MALGARVGPQLNAPDMVLLLRVPSVACTSRVCPPCAPQAPTHPVPTAVPGVRPLLPHRAGSLEEAVLVPQSR